MTRPISRLLMVFSLSLCSTTWLLAQSLSADSFLDSVSGRPVGDQAEQDKAREISQALNIAPASEVQRLLPAVLMHTRSGGEAHERGYATIFLFMIAMRPDGAALLSAKSEEIASLILDANPDVQRGALAAMDYVIGKAGTNNQPYLSALQTALQKTQTPQDAAVEMIGPLLTFAPRDPGALKSVLAFLQRDDLTSSTRSDLVHHLGAVPELPEEVNQYLVRRLDDPDPRVRAAALVSYADSTTSFHTLSRARVGRMANDPQENPQVRELAKKALAGHTGLNPIIDMPPDKPKDH
jgi:hypothetical protein